MATSTGNSDQQPTDPIRTTIDLDPSLHHLLKRWAAEEDLPIVDVVNALADQMLSDETLANQTRRIVQRRRLLVGDQLRQLEINKRDADHPNHEDDEPNLQRTLTVAIWQPDPMINIAVNVTDPDGRDMGNANISVDLDDLEAILAFAQKNRYAS